MNLVKLIHTTLFTHPGNLSQWSSGTTATIQRSGCSGNLVSEGAPFDLVKAASAFQLTPGMDSVPIAAEITLLHDHPHGKALNA